MTTAARHGERSRRPAPGSAPPPAGPWWAPAAAGWRLVRLYLISRRAPAALVLLTGLGALQWASLRWHWYIAGGAAARHFFLLTFEAGAAAVISVTTFGPFGEPERASGRWLPWLRLGAAVALTAAAYGLLCAGAALAGTTWAGAGVSAPLPGGTLALLRDLGGMSGVGMLAAALFGGAFGCTGPLAYLLVTEGALAHQSASPWVWPARPPLDRGGAVCACLVAAVALALITVRGPREQRGGSGPA